jgi:hypothetical protein
MQYRKKPVVIEAVQLKPNEASILECFKFMGDASDFTSRIASEKFSDYCFDIIRENKGIKIKTLESDGETQTASFEDFIIKGVHGEFYPCKPDIFEKTYEKV